MDSTVRRVGTRAVALHACELREEEVQHGRHSEALYVYAPLEQASLLDGASQRQHVDVRGALGRVAPVLVAHDAVEDRALVEVRVPRLRPPLEEVARHLEHVVLRARLLGLGREEVAQVALHLHVSPYISLYLPATWVERKLPRSRGCCQHSPELEPPWSGLRLGLGLGFGLRLGLRHG